MSLVYLFSFSFQVRHNETWGSVCADGWSRESASILCKQLGFFDALTAITLSPSEGDLIWLNGITCSGSETELDECIYEDFGTPVTCDSGEVAAVVCTMGKL